MRNSLLFLAVTLVSGSSALAQTNSGYQIDNFDFSNGVRIETPAAPPAKKPSRPSRQLAASQNFKYTPAAKSLTQLTSMNVNPSLAVLTTGDSSLDNLIVQ